MALRALSEKENIALLEERKKRLQENAKKECWYIINANGHFFAVTQDIPLDQSLLENEGCLFFTTAEQLALHIASFDESAYSSPEEVEDALYRFTMEEGSVVQYCDRLIRHCVEQDVAEKGINAYFVSWSL